MQVEQGLLALLGEDFPFGIAAASLLDFPTTHRQDLRCVVADLADVGIPLLKEHPLAAIENDLVTQLNTALEAKLVLNITHSQDLRMAWYRM